MSTPIERLSALTIGTVEFVSPGEIKVLLETDAPQATALNTGVPNRFPRINGYVLIPNEGGAVVGLIVWLGVERSAFPKRSGLKDFGLIDLPFPLRKLSVTPIGTLVSTKEDESEKYYFKLERGVSIYPSVGDHVLLPTEDQLRSIIEAKGKDRRVNIGVSPLAADAEVTVDPDKLFGRHLAILGNTGSGKSCTVAGLIRWSLESAERNIVEDQLVNARFIILDPNGEYKDAFSDMNDKVRIFKMTEQGQETFKQLTVPAWMWNSMEWGAFAHAQPGTQRPILQRGLREMRSGSRVEASFEIRSAVHFNARFNQLRNIVGQGPSSYTGRGRSTQCGTLLRMISEEAQRFMTEASGDLAGYLSDLAAETNRIKTSKYWAFPDGSEGYRDFSLIDLESVLEKFGPLIALLPRQKETMQSEDAPIMFQLSDFPEYLQLLAEESGAAQFIEFLNMRIRNMLADRRLKPIVNPDKQPQLTEWLDEYIGGDSARNGQIAILDLSLVPSDVLHIVISVIGRIIFEALQRYRKLNRKELPTVLVLEEAHSFVQRSTGEEDGMPTSAQMCRYTFERIAREGRKFGLGLVLSSQRPSELSPTVLAQCNTFLLHRIVNDRDQELVGRLVPDYLGGLLKELPSLPTRQAILLGWATPVPVLVEIKNLPENQRPRSADPEFWDVWIGKEKRPINWKEVVSDWIGKGEEPQD